MDFLNSIASALLAMTLLDWLGWIANGLFAGGYFLVAKGKIKGTGLAFNLMNLGGAVLYGIYAFVTWIPSVLCLEIFWSSIALNAICRVYWPKPETK